VIVIDLERWRRETGRRIASPIAGVLSRGRLTPDMLTIAGLLLSLLCAYLVVVGQLLLAGLVLLASGLCDMLDGALARHVAKSSRFGAILDSTLDRASEAAVFCALTVAYASKGSMLAGIVALAVLVGSFLVSYIRARAEGLGLQCRAGLFTRPERVIVLAAGLLTSYVMPALWVLLGGVYFTVIQRLAHVHKESRSAGV
jgi:CDP-diacylglycerol--glycerol-3-phosphate 3-phosphatidyltransferase